MSIEPKILGVDMTSGSVGSVGIVCAPRVWSWTHKSRSPRLICASYFVDLIFRFDYYTQPFTQSVCGKLKIKLFSEKIGNLAKQIFIALG